MSRVLVSGARVVDQPGADSVLIAADGTVEAVGRTLQLRRPSVPEVTHPDGFLIAGLTDAHIHPVGYAVTATGLTLHDVSDFDDLTDRIRTWAGRLPPGIPVVGNRLDEATLAEGRLPTAEDLDGILAARPILLNRVCGHVAVANHAALDLAGIGPGSWDPPSGAIGRDPDGSITGRLEESAVSVVSSALDRLLPGPGPDQIDHALRHLVSMGLTRLQAMVAPGTGLWCGSGLELPSLLALADRLPLDIDLYVSAGTPNELRDAADQIEEAGGRLRFGGWKGFADGSLGGRTAALNRPYADRPDASGMLRIQYAHFAAMVETALDLGGSTAVHAIGDRALSAVLDLYQQISQRRATRVGQLRVEHASLLDGPLIERMAALEITASVQPLFIESDGPWLPERLGPDRLSMAYPFGSMQRAGIRLLGGSDAPVEDPNPWRGMAAARRRYDLRTDEQLDGALALELYQQGARIEVGGAADLVVVDRNPEAVSPELLESARVLDVWKNGVRLTPPPPLPWQG